MSIKRWKTLEKVKQSRRQQTFICKNGAHADPNHVRMQLQANCSFVGRIIIVAHNFQRFAKFSSIRYRCQFLKDICIFGSRWKWPSAHCKCMSYFDQFCSVCCVNSMGSRVFDIEIDDNDELCPSDYFHRQWLSEPRTLVVSWLWAHFFHFSQRWRRFLLPINYYTSTVKYLWYEFCDTLFTNWMYSNS